jgi:ketosteroid isomerase-like protein
MTAGTHDPLDELLALKDDVLEAMDRGDSEVFAAYIAEEAIALSPLGMLDKSGLVRIVCGAARFQNIGMDLVQASMVAADMGLVVFRARFARPDGVDLTMLTSMLFRRTPDGWKGVFFQQTPIAPPQQTSGG